jgi:phosphoglycolate phosphatase
MPPYRLLIFDFDGTLSNSFPFLVSIFAELADRYRFKHVSAEELSALRDQPAGVIMRTLGIPAWKAPRIGSEVKRRMSTQTGQVDLFPGIGDLLDSLGKRGTGLALVTSNAPGNVNAVLGPDRLAYFQYVECDVPLQRKNAAFLKILKRSGLPRENVLCIGDEIRDLEAAHRAGLAFGAVAWGYTEIRALQAAGPEVVFTEIQEILDLGE